MIDPDSEVENHLEDDLAFLDIDDDNSLVNMKGESREGFTNHHELEGYSFPDWD